MVEKVNADIIENLVMDTKKCSVDIKYKCPEYILAAKRRYYSKKNTDPEFVEKERERIRQYRAANREHVNEIERLRKAKIRLAKKESKVDNKTESGKDGNSDNFKEKDIAVSEKEKQNS